MFLRRKTPLNPSTQFTSLLRITSRHFSMYLNRNPNKTDSISDHDDDEPSSAYYDELINNAGRSGDFTTLHHLFNKRYKDGCFNTSNTFKFLTETDTDINTDLDDLLQTLSNLDKGFARKNAFDCLISHLCKTNNIDEALRVIDTMIEKEIGVKACTFHPLLNTLTREKCFEEAWLVLDKMREIGIPVDIMAYNHILTAHCVKGDLVEAARVMEKILEDGLKEDSKTYDALVMGACRAGKVEGALVLLRKMEESGLPALYSTHAHVIKSLVGMGCFAQGVEFVKAFGGRNKGLDTENFGYLLSCLVRRKRVEEAKLVFEEMEKRGLVMGIKLRKLTVIILLTSTLLAIAEAAVPDSANGQPYLLTLSGIVGLAAVTDFITQPYSFSALNIYLGRTVLLDLSNWKKGFLAIGRFMGYLSKLSLPSDQMYGNHTLHFSVCILCYCGCSSRIDIPHPVDDNIACSKQSPIEAAALSAVGQFWLRLVVLISYYYISHHSKKLSKVRNLPAPLLVAALATGIHVAAKWTRFRHLTWMLS
ncbi:hypothetical protein AQUCO_00200809v1 [Aquilegia coerulea]|uniref:Pentatricopeptide repeat-containing protein-mitochondrial domain-containing protein n=1 Tax=Aquilegia coerulea TaxID=218851 RepID=A0A2G5F4T3_AQUCA|nr:hypothetical protein AQUCO_00200809v1 [Aquilegia coerulea]